MSTEAKHKKSDLKKYLPVVHTRNGTYIFNPDLIYRSLLKETSISESDAKQITKRVIQFLISAHLNIITAPLIREVANIYLLKRGLEKERLQYTRIGLPFYDLHKKFQNPSNSKYIVSDIINWVITEYHAVHKLKKNLITRKWIVNLP